MDNSEVRGSSFLPNLGKSLMPYPRRQSFTQFHSCKNFWYHAFIKQLDRRTAANLLTVSWHSPTTWTETESTKILERNLTIYQTTRRGIPVHFYVYRHWWEHPISLYVAALCFSSSRFWRQCIVYFTHDYLVFGPLQLSVLMFQTPFCIASQFSVSRLCFLSGSLIWISTPLPP